MLGTGFQDGNRRQAVHLHSLRLRNGTTAFLADFDGYAALFDFNRFDIVHIVTKDISFFS